MLGTTVPSSTLTLVADDERREPMGLAQQDCCSRCQGPVLRTDTSGLCWSCMPTGRAAA